MADNKQIYGWRAICAYLGLSRRRILSLGFPVYTLPYNKLVWAEKDALDEHFVFLKRDLCSKRLENTRDPHRQA